MFSSSPPFPSSSSPSVMMLHEQAAPAVASWSSTSTARHFPTSVLLQEQREEYRPLLHAYNKEATLNTRQMDMSSVQEKCNTGNPDQLVHDFVHQLHLRSHLQNLLTCYPTREIAASLTLQPVDNDSERPADGLPRNAVSLAQQALSASKQAASSIEVDDDDDDPLSFGLASTSLVDSSLKRNKIVRSTRITERRSKQRKASKSNLLDEESYLDRKSFVQRKLRLEKKLNEGFDQNDPLRMFLSGSESRQLLTREEESQLITQLQDFSRLEEVKIRLQSQLRREPTLAEWADVLGLSCCALQTQLHCVNRSKEKLFHANMRMVVHIAKHYQGRGLSLQDLFQEGSTGLMKSIDKFKPGAGCRFGTYAYWWIRHSIRKAIFLHSRTIRIPENLYRLLGKVIEAKKLFIQEGNINPSKEELARRVGITIDKLETLVFASRNPISMQQAVWADQETTFQEITADSAIEIPDVCVSRQLMRRHVHNLLNMLSPKEKSIIRLRFGIEDGKEKTLSDIGKVFGLTKERVRQLESRALSKLKECLESQGLDAYTDLLI
ncbi:RNA polymerase sigma factor sigF, chloroplastic isoform X1 [Vigna radiata var. radiata]|uniref:RNA polymerase sigma factor sigF, chloroplastic isoform X1 n=1 Tax=Vigna radiata var. radiata TaxID=3916 RepID=A0A1S3TQR5_VIGRR|nr:RNA polymerase sigma factor sigF, chloroplastic isoform X1 [Vigna radiata var. radiata]